MRLSTVIIVSAACLFGFTAYQLGLNNAELVGRLNTVYTQDFSYRRFQQIKPGMTKDQVRNLIGDPFQVTGPHNLCFWYSREAKWNLPPFIFTAVWVCFDPSQKVVGTYETAFGC